MTRFGIINKLGAGANSLRAISKIYMPRKLELANKRKKEMEEV